MPRKVHMYCCTACHDMYQQLHDAIRCEALPPMPREFEDGATIQFHNEQSMFGRYSYQMDEGIVLHAFQKVGSDDDGQPSHIWCYIVELKGHEAEVQRVPKGARDYGGQLFSLGERKFKLGYATSMKSDDVKFLHESHPC